MRSIMLVLCLTGAKAHAGSFNCMDLLRRGLERLIGPPEDWAWHHSFPGTPLPSERNAYRDRLTTDMAQLRSTFEATETGSLKTRIAIREIDHTTRDLGRLDPKPDSLSLEAWKLLDLKERQTLYYTYLVRLFYDRNYRADLLDHPAELIRAAASAVATAEGSGTFTVHQAMPGWFPYTIDVDPILREKAAR